MAVKFDNAFRFHCTQCGQCCTRPGTVYLSPAEIAAIARFRGVTPEALAAAYRAPDDLVLDADPGSSDEPEDGWYIDVPPGGGCPFLEDARCSIHSVKPEQCRTYPFWPEIVASPETWQAEAPYCPGIGRGRVYTAREVRALSRGRGATYE